MCGRFSNADPGEQFIRLLFLSGLPAEYSPRYNIAPSQRALVVVSDENANRTAGMFRWGLIPSWARDPSIGNRLINARAETLAEKPAFRQAFRKRRCVIPATGFYEWRRQGKRGLPYNFRLRSGEVFVFAGLWEQWTTPTGPWRTFTIITTEANATVRPVHDRMPAILQPPAVDAWLDHRSFNARRLEDLLRPFPAEKMEGFRVSPMVNSPVHDEPACIQPLDEE